MLACMCLGDVFMQIPTEMQVHAQLDILMYVHHYTHTFAFIWKGTCAYIKLYTLMHIPTDTAHMCTSRKHRGMPMIATQY